MLPLEAPCRGSQLHDWIKVHTFFTTTNLDP